MEIDSVRIDESMIFQFSDSNRLHHRYKLETDKIFDLVLNHLTTEECRSLIFLLMDKLNGFDEYLNLSVKNKSDMIRQIKTVELNEETFVELLGTIKAYDALFLFDTCGHIFEKMKENFQNIRKIWKILYAICEEITDQDLKDLTNFAPFQCYRNQIFSAEDWFIIALKCGVISHIDFSFLNKVFQENSTCLNLLKQLDGPKLNSYELKLATQESHCGLALIINYESFDQLQRRFGSEKDVESLKTLWDTFGFKPIEWKNLSKDETLWKIKSLARNYDPYEQYDAFICCILSHGNENVFYSSDSQTISIKEFICTFSGNCRHLVNKPKLFFIQACQGSMVLNDKFTKQCLSSDYLYYESDLSLSATKVDIIAVVATINGFVSFRHAEKGSIFVQSLSNIMNLHGSTCSLLDIITQVTNDVTNHRISIGEGSVNAIQIPPTYQTLRKTLILRRRQF